MQLTPRQVYLTMFDALDAAWDLERTDRLREYLSEANPYLWEGGSSADPAVYNGFASSFEEGRGGDDMAPENALKFVRNYLDKQNEAYSWADGDLMASFDSVVTPELWEQALEGNAN